MIKPVYETNSLVMDAAQSILGYADEYGMRPSVLAALQKGVHILGSHRFQQGNQNNAAYVRLSIISLDTEEELSHALEIL